jgi:hypothetical protein
VLISFFKFSLFLLAMSLGLSAQAAQKYLYSFGGAGDGATDKNIFVDNFIALDRFGQVKRRTPVPNLFCKFLTAAILVVSMTAFAAENKAPTQKALTTQTSQCGIFQVTGYLKKAGNSYFILLAPGSRSEAQITLSSQAIGDAKNPVLLPARESFVTAKIEMKSPMMHYRGAAQKISEINLAVPNEMRGDKGTGLRLLKANPCIIPSM